MENAASLEHAEDSHMRIIGNRLTAGIIGVTTVIGSAFVAATPASAGPPSDDGAAVHFTVDNAADVGDANPGDGRCEIAVDDAAKDVLGNNPAALPQVGKGKTEEALPSLYPQITPQAPAASPGRCTLRAAVEEANANVKEHHRVTLPSRLGVYHLTEGHLGVRGHLTITRDYSAGSKRAAINAGHRSRIFGVTDGAHLHIDGLFLAQGKAPNLSGGAIYVRRATVELDRSVVVHSHANRGGAIAVDTDGRLEARSTSFESNRADLGGAIYAVGSVLLHQVSIYDNAAELGGGVYLLPQADESFWAEQTSVIDNTASRAGGGLYFYGEGYVGMIHATIAANAADHGGGIYNGSENAAFLIAYSILAGNTDTENPTAADASPDCDGEMSTDRGNLFGAIGARCYGYDVAEDTYGTVRNPLDPSLEFVRISTDANAQGDGGELAYRRPAFNSPALDMVPAGRCFSNDDMLRAGARSGVPCDLGAIER